jgi:hypothetical protein
MTSGQTHTGSAWVNIPMVGWPICGSGQLRECWKVHEFSVMEAVSTGTRRYFVAETEIWRGFVGQVYSVPRSRTQSLLSGLFEFVGE